MDAMKTKPRITAILQASLVTFLWSTSWVLIKIGLHDNLPAITFAGLRYMLAFACLVPFVFFNPLERAELMKLSLRDWGTLALLGVVTYTWAQSAQFLSLVYLPAAMVSLVLNLTPLFVSFSGIGFLNEHPAPLQWVGVALTVIGVGFYFLPVAIPQAQMTGILITLSCLAGNVLASLLGRGVNRDSLHSPLLITFVSMGIGSVLMLTIGIATQGIGELSWQDWAIIAWLAAVNTALAFTIWNQTLRTLTAAESSIINSLMMPQIAILALVFLGETLTAKEIIGLVLVSAGVIAAQLKRQRVLAQVQQEAETSRGIELRHE